jgi:hypothetical protein
MTQNLHRKKLIRSNINLDKQMPVKINGFYQLTNKEKIG